MLLGTVMGSIYCACDKALRLKSRALDRACLTALSLAIRVLHVLRACDAGIVFSCFQSAQLRHPPSLDPVASARWLARPTQASAWLHEEIAARMIERLDIIRLQPQAWLHWAPLRGGLRAHQALRTRYPRASTWLWHPNAGEALQAARQLQAPWWQPARWRAAPQHEGLPAAGQVQMVWANMALHHSADPQAWLKAWHRALAVDGFVMFSCLGPDTLQELRSLYAERGWGAPAHEFTDMHDWGDMLVQEGFAEPVMDMERLTLTYETPQRLLQELRELGRNLHVQRAGTHGGLRGRDWLAQLLQALQLLVRPDAQGRLSLTFELVYGHALKPRPKVKMQAESAIAVDDLRQMLKDGRAPQRKL
jgi:malonyl-CoA O-methyltransferase